MASVKRRWKLRALLAVVVVVTFWAGWNLWEARRYRRAMSVIEEDVEAGRYALAARNLVALLAWNPGSEEAAYLLGVCERARGLGQAASEAWARVPPGSPHGLEAIQGRMELLIESGRLADAEQLINDAMTDPRSDAAGLSLLLGPVFCLEGRVDEAMRFIEASWNHLAETGYAASEAAISLVRLHIEQDRTSMPVEAVRSALEEAGRSAAADERIGLGKANLAIRTGLFDEAARWLDACLRRRPDDVPVWRARLNWAVASGHAADAREAMKHLPAAESTPPEVEKLAAWFAAQRGDAASERRALERLSQADPTDFAALDRLAELAAKHGQPDHAAELRGKKTEIDRRKARYQRLHGRRQPRRDAAEMARLAEQLGRRFEARAFLTLAVAADPDRKDLASDLARLKQHAPVHKEPGLMLAELLAPELDSPGSSTLAPTRPQAARDAGAR
jgi:tetratricopeptide (TPR) repeat protein